MSHPDPRLDCARWIFAAFVVLGCIAVLVYVLTL